MNERRPRSGWFGAPWGRGVRVATTVVVVLVSGLAVLLPLTVSPADIWQALLPPGLAVLALGVTALFCVRGYTVRQRALLIHRSFWATRLSLEDLRRAYPDAEAMKRTMRTFGNGGFMAYTGWFRNRRLGSYRAFVTDPARCVVLEFANRRVVVSPDDPAAFVRALGFDPDGPGSRH